MRSVKRVSAVSGGWARVRRVWAMCCFGGGGWVIFGVCGLVVGGGDGRREVGNGKKMVISDKLIGGST